MYIKYIEPECIKLTMRKTQMSLNKTIYNLSNDTINRILLQICNGLKELEGLSLNHFNLTPSNVLCCSSGKIYISDFLINEIRNSNNIPFESLFYLSPENLLGKELSIKSDIFSLGCIIYYLFTNTSPFQTNMNEEIENNILIPIEYKNIIKKTIKINPVDRPTLKEMELSLKNIHKIYKNEINNEIQDSHSTIQILLRSNCIKYSIENHFIFTNADYLNISHKKNEILSIINLYETNHHYQYIFILINIIWNNYNELLRNMILIELSKVQHKRDLFLQFSMVHCACNDFTLSLYRQGLNDNGLKELISNFTACSSLKSLNLINNNISSKYMRIFTESLTYLPYLTNLRMEDNPVGDEGISYLCKYLPLLLIKKKHTKEYSLCFFQMNINYLGMRSIVHYLNTVKHVRHIDFGYNNLDDDSLLYFSEHSNKLKHLKTISFNGNNITDKSIPYIINIIEQHPRLQAIGLEPSRIYYHFMNLTQRFPNLRFVI